MKTHYDIVIKIKDQEKTRLKILNKNKVCELFRPCYINTATKRVYLVMIE